MLASTNKWNRSILTVAGCSLAAVFIISGCASINVHENVTKQSDKIYRYFPELMTNSENLPEMQLDWDIAVSMLENNLNMQNVAEEVIKTEESIKRVFLDLIPMFTLQGIYSQGVRQITELSSDNFNFTINALFQIPDILRLRMDYYGAMLACYKARKQYELIYREEVVNLYSLFRQHQRMKIMRTVESLDSAHPTFSNADQKELEFRQKQREAELWFALSTALGCYTNRWIIAADGLPEFDYLASNPQWDDPNGFGKLLVTLEAVELEGARLREMGINFQYWPQLTMRVYSPSVNLLSGGNRGGFEFDVDDTRFEAAVRMKLDANLQIRDQLRETRRNTDLLKKKLYKDAQERTRKLIEAYDALSILDTRLQQLLAREELLNMLPLPAFYEAFEANLSKRIELMNQRISLEKELDSIIAILWIADESKWPAVMSEGRSESVAPGGPKL